MKELIDKAKKEAARAALKHIENEMIIGFGSGSTVSIFIEELREFLQKNKLRIYGVSTSIDTSLKLLNAGIDVLDPLTVEEIDLAIDGADSVITDKKILIKGGGGAFTREKVVDYWAKRLIIIVDETKINRQHPIPIEILPSAIKYVKKELERMFEQNILELRDCKGKLGPCISDNGNIIGDLNLEINKIEKRLEKELKSIPGVIENGIFTRDATIIIGKKTGETLEMRI